MVFKFSDFVLTTLMAIFFSSVSVFAADSGSQESSSLTAFQVLVVHVAYSRNIW
jgi:hypothetical protein